MKDQLAKISIDGYEDSRFACGPFQQCLISRIGASLSRFDDVVSFRPEPARNQIARASVDQKPH
jgi:hypothetical protein